MSQLNIVELIETNPITKLSKTYNNKLLNKIQENFSGLEQQLFISSFYCYLNYDKKLDFVIDLDNVWKWLGFNQKYNAKVVLEKHFIIDVDYKNLTPATSGATINKSNIKTASPKCEAIIEQDKLSNDIIKKEKEEKWGGHNKQTIMLNIKCFKSLCLKAQTKKADEIHEYYMKMEEVLCKTLEEETDELKFQLEQKDNVILEKDNAILEKDNVILEKDTTIKNAKRDKLRSIEQTIITQFPVNTECIYIGTIDNTNDAKEQLIKFGHTNNLGVRILDHRKKYDNFILIEAFRVQNKVEIENLLKSSLKIMRHIRTIQVNGLDKTEIIAYDNTNFTIPRLSKYIKDIILSKTYSIDNFNNLLKKYELIQDEVRELKNTILSLTTENTRLALELNEVKELAERQKKSLDLIKSDEVFNPEASANATNTTNKTNNKEDVKDDLTKRFDEFIEKACIVRKDVEVDSCDIIAQFRIWNGVKAKRETNERLNLYLKTRFLAARLQNQAKDQCVHGFVGVMLKPIEYKKTTVNDETETFIFETCRFAPNNRIATTKLHEEFLKYKNKMDLDITHDELSNIKKYLDKCCYVLKGTLHIQEENFTHEGYYGLGLKTDNPNLRKVSSNTGKKVQKIDNNTGALLNNWDTIAKAAIYEKVSAAKMSRSIKNKVVFDDYYYAVEV